MIVRVVSHVPDFGDDPESPSQDPVISHRRGTHMLKDAHPSQEMRHLSKHIPRLPAGHTASPTRDETYPAGDEAYPS